MLYVRERGYLVLAEMDLELPRFDGHFIVQEEGVQVQTTIKSVLTLGPTSYQ